MTEAEETRQLSKRMLVALAGMGQLARAYPDMDCAPIVFAFVNTALAVASDDDIAEDATGRCAGCAYHVDDDVLDEIAEWLNRPVDTIMKAFLDALHSELLNAEEHPAKPGTFRYWPYIRRADFERWQRRPGGLRAPITIDDIEAMIADLDQREGAAR